MSEHDQTQPYKVLARKYRPASFADLIGQEPMVQTLSNAFRTGRIAQAYMLTGVRGVGKTTTARILARALNYKTSDVDQPTIELAEEGEHCRAIIEGRHIDVIEMDAASHTGIDDIRDLIESAQYRPATSRYKVYIIDEVHMLSKSAFNGLLKTLEEPPEHLKFIFATTEIRKVPITVLSRCQRFDLRRIEADAMTEHLEWICKHEAVEAEDTALAAIARSSEGSVRDALSMLDQAIAHSAMDAESKITSDATRLMLGLSDRTRIVDLFEMIMRGDIASALEELKSQYDTGAEPLVVLTDLADFIHLVTRLKYVPDTKKDKALSEVEREKGAAFAEALSVRVLGRAWQMTLKGIEEVSSAERPLMVAEMVLVRITHGSTLPTPDEFVKQETPQGGDRTATLSAGNVSPQPASTDPVNQGAGAMTPAIPTQASSPQQSGLRDGNSSAPALAMSAPQPKAEIQTSDIPPKSDRVLQTFEELIFLIEDKRDLPLKTAIKRHIRLVSFSDGQMEMNLVENPPRDFLPTLGKRLEEWTGKRWMLSVSATKGAPTLAEQEQEENKNRMDDARDDMSVKAIMQVFPGTKIVNIRIREEDAESLPEAPDETEDVLDEFF
ncbi:MAG: DNA polymerase III subunit gamma/tau [Pseudomonadota bacterium]